MDKSDNGPNHRQTLHLCAEAIVTKRACAIHTQLNEVCKAKSGTNRAKVKAAACNSSTNLCKTACHRMLLPMTIHTGATLCSITQEYLQPVMNHKIVQMSRRCPQFSEVSIVLPTNRRILVCPTHNLLPLICCNTQREQSWVGAICTVGCQLCHTV